MIRQLRFILIFYRSFGLFTFLSSFWGWVYITQGAEAGSYQMLKAMPLFICFLLLLHLLVIWYQMTFYPGRILFCYNLGISRRRLFALTFLLDFLVFLTAAIVWETVGR